MIYFATRITSGLGKSHFLEMAALDLNLRSLLLRTIEVNLTERYSSQMLLGDQWLTSCGVRPLQRRPEDRLSSEDQHQVATVVKAALNVPNPPEAILAHLKKRPLFTTGGMYNLLALEILDESRHGGSRLNLAGYLNGCDNF